MPILADCHLHSDHSGDSDTPMEAQVLSGIRAGLTDMCFTEHYDPFFPYDRTPEVATGTFELDLLSYRHEYLRLRDIYAGQIRLHCGIELGIQPHLGTYLRDYEASLAETLPELDMLIGSCHLCFGSDPYYPSFLEGHTEEEAIRAYLTDTLADIRAFPSVDTWGHLDYLVRYLPHRQEIYSYDRFRSEIDLILDALLENGIALEVNTAPLGKGLDYFHPLPDILRRYRQLGGDLITVGSDAHRPGVIAAGFSRACSMLTDFGFHSYAVFEHRKPVMYRL